MRIAHTAIIAVLLALVASCTGFGERHEWSILQVAEFNNRGASVDSRILVERYEGYCLIGVIADDGVTRSWVLMNPRFPPVRKRVPDVSVGISRRDFDLLPSDCRQNRSVAASLIR